MLGGYDARRYAGERLRTPARDGAVVPVSLVYARSRSANGPAPLLLYGYGSYGSIAGSALRSAPLISLLDRGFVYAIAHVRGGQEMGAQLVRGRQDC